nr:MAG TPA: hypothetical protein [Caudoviricetes sp.]
MKAYKGFDKNMQCRGFQFEEGKTYHEDESELCKRGFHACENPLDVFGYYSPGKNSIYREVELEDVSEERNSDDTKVCAKTIKIGAKLDVAGLCKAHFEYVSARCNPANGRVAGDKESAAAGESGSAAAGYKGSAAAGNCGSAAAGNWGSAAAGKQGIACCRGGNVKGGIGAVLALSELDDNGNNISAKAVVVDGKTIKANTWYTLKNGEFVEV